MQFPAERPAGNVRVLVLFTGTRLFGHERANIEVFRAMKLLGIKARFIVDRRWSSKELQPALRAMGLEFTTAAYGYQWGGFLRGRQWYLGLLNAWGVLATSIKILWNVLRWRPTHLYAANSLHLSYAVPALSLSRLPLIYRAGDELPVHTWFHRWIAQWIARRATTVVCISKYLRQRYLDAGVNENKLRVIYNHPPERGAAAVSPAIDQPAGCVITFIGQISEHKGVIVLLDAVEKMRVRRTDFVVWLLGAPSWDSGLLETLRDRVKSRGLDDIVIFWGYRTDIPAFLRHTDIHVCPSLFAEPLSNVVGEAAMAAVPSVVFPVGGLPELIEHKVTGFLCRDSSKDALIEGLEFFLDEPARRKAAGLKARQHFETNFGFAGFQQQWADVFRDSLPSC